MPFQKGVFVVQSCMILHLLLVYLDSLSESDSACLPHLLWTLLTIARIGQPSEGSSTQSLSIPS